MTFPYPVYQKIIISGFYVEYYRYEKPYWVGYPRFVSKYLSGHFVRSMPQISLREDNVRRTRIKIRRLVNCNKDLIKFMTLTFSSPVLDLKIANTFLKSFIQRLIRFYPDLKYLCVPEFQLRSGRVHYHLLTNLPFIENDVLFKMWRRGFVFIRKVDSVDNMGAYVCKYLGKANFDKRYFRLRKFSYSANLFRPLVVDKSVDVNYILENLPVDFPFLCEKTFEFQFCSKYLNMIYYKQYKLAEFIKVASSNINK